MSSKVTKINIEVCPALVTATLTQKSICKCGKPVYDESSIYQTQFNVDLKSIRWARWTCYSCGTITDVRLIDVFSDLPFVPIKYIILDLLDIGAAIPEEEKPTQWQAVKDGKVAPKDYYPSPQILN